MSSDIKSYKDLKVWSKGIATVKEVYRITDGFPAQETYGLTSQMRRAAVSIPSNVAEGYGRNYTKNFGQFLKTSRGSLLELETQTIIAQELNFISEKDSKDLNQMIVEENKMLNALIRSLEKPTIGYSPMTT